MVLVRALTFTARRFRMSPCVLPSPTAQLLATRECTGLPGFCREFPRVLCSAMNRGVGSVEAGATVARHCRAQVGAVGGGSGANPISKLLGQLKQARRDELQRIVEQLTAAGVLQEPKAMTQVLSILRRHHRWQLAVELHKKMPDPKVFTYSATISACAKGGAPWSKAVELLREMIERGIKPNVITYNATISACEKGGAPWSKAVELLREMVERGIEPDVFTYSATISACAKGGAPWHKAVELLREMVERGIKPNVISYNAAISACAKGGAPWHKAVELLREMVERGIKPTVISYSATISACEKGGAPWSKAVELLREMVERGIKPTVISYSATISACEKGGASWEKAVELLREMIERGIEPDDTSYNATIEVLVNAQQDCMALALFGDTVRAGHYQAAAISHSGRGTENKVDLHDLPAAVAKVAVMHKLASLSDRDRAVGLTIVPGKGNRSEGEAVLRPAIMELLGTPPYAGLCAAVAEQNQGRIVIAAQHLAGWSPCEG